MNTGQSSIHLLPRRLGELLYRATRRAIMLDVTRLLVLRAAEARPPVIDHRYEFRWLSPAEVSAHAVDPATGLSAQFATRMAAGLDLCFAALSGEHLAAYLWLALGSIEAEHNRGHQPNSGVAMSFATDAAFVYKAFTRPEHRGRQLYTACLVRSLNALDTRGIRRLLVTADWTNHAAIQGCRRAGCADVGLVWRMGCGRLGYTRAPSAAAALGIQLGREAQVSKRTVSVGPPACCP
jgi:hypothetical protein